MLIYPCSIASFSLLFPPACAVGLCVSSTFDLALGNYGHDEISYDDYCYLRHRTSLVVIGGLSSVSLDYLDDSLLVLRRKICYAGVHLLVDVDIYHQPVR